MSGSIKRLMESSQVDKNESSQYFEDQASMMMQKKKLDRIDNFNEYYEFLNNDFYCNVYYEGIKYHSISHAYQAARNPDLSVRLQISKAETLQEMYAIAGEYDDPPKWDSNKLKVMDQLVRDKFRRSRDLREKLKATEDRELVNTYQTLTESNIYWGIYERVGKNQLGRILQELREDVNKNMELDKWIYTNLDLQDNKSFFPVIKLDVLKDQKTIQEILLKDKAVYFLGCLKTNDVMMVHQSISRNHAIIVNTNKEGICIVDLGSKAGTFVNRAKIHDHVAVRLAQNAELMFGGSTRKYVVSIDYDAVHKQIEKMNQHLQTDLKILKKIEDPNVNREVLKESLGLIRQDTIFISNIPKNASRYEIEDIFIKYGPIISCRLPTDHHTGSLRGIAFITYKKDEDARKAVLGQNKKFLREQQIYVKIAEKSTHMDDELLLKLEEMDDDTKIKRLKKDLKMNKEHKEKTNDLAQNDFKQRFKKDQTLQLQNHKEVELNTLQNKSHQNNENESHHHKQRRRGRHDNHDSNRHNSNNDRKDRHDKNDQEKRIRSRSREWIRKKPQDKQDKESKIKDQQDILRNKTNKVLKEIAQKYKQSKKSQSSADSDSKSSNFSFDKNEEEDLHK